MVPGQLCGSIAAYERRQQLRPLWQQLPHWIGVLHGWVLRLRGRIHALPRGMRGFLFLFQRQFQLRQLRELVLDWRELLWRGFSQEYLIGATALFRGGCGSFANQAIKITTLDIQDGAASRDTRKESGAALCKQPSGQFRLGEGPLPDVVVYPGILSGERVSAGFAAGGHAITRQRDGNSLVRGAVEVPQRSVRRGGAGVLRNAAAAGYGSGEKVGRLASMFQAPAPPMDWPVT